MGQEQAATIFILCLLGYGAWRLYIMIEHPEVYRDQMRQKHELEMAKRARNQKALGILGTVLSIFFRR